MAQKVQVILVDDIDGGEADENITFGLDGVMYEIDLSESNAEELRSALAQWVAAARKTGGRSTAPTKKAKATQPALDEPTPVEVREWAATQGITVSPKGRISQTVIDQYKAAKA